MWECYLIQSVTGLPEIRTEFFRNPSVFNVFLLCCKQRIEVGLLLGVFKHLGAINLGKGMKHRNLLQFSSDVP